ncbi:hypothetical protein COT48_02730 [Candidatus Woesearchaeota archaeon CG08_land_8_20_14_0_20_47_9]|nr:MAG: hypothetical protein COT48_02730 [Candidatus Woesearchaeota archaeon CG08_land_8_20_14_0_20_47_9]HII30347.1 hypothetical protein [Candidatus Woesearchaeota archaeon]
MQIKEIIDSVEKDASFKKWRKEYREPFLASVFVMFDKAPEKAEWLVGYYNKKNAKVTSFILSGSKICPKPECETLLKNQDVLPLETSAIRIDFDEAVKLAGKAAAKSYHGETQMKTIVVLQANKEFGQHWNIAYVTRGFKSINIKLSCKDGKIMQSKINSLIDISPGKG